MIEELLDRVTENGFFTFSDLRDTVSGNQLKLADLADPHSFWRGDPLLRLDRRLATSMEGVYRAGEFYLRWLESGSSLLFGTVAGRLLTRNVLLPFGGAFLLICAIVFLWNHYGHQEDGPSVLSFGAIGGFVVPLGAFVLSLMYVERLRDWFADAGRRTFRGLRYVFYEMPGELWRLQWLRSFLSSWPSLLLYWYVLKPLAVWCVLVMIWPDRFASVPAALATFVIADIFLNSYFGTAVGEGLQEALVLLYGWLRFDALRGLVRIVSAFFKQVTDAVETVLYSVDEWLRFRSEVSGVSMALRRWLGCCGSPSATYSGSTS